MTAPARASMGTALRAAGIGLASQGAASVLGSELARVAHRVRELRRRAIALLPVGDDVAVPAVAVELGRWLGHASRAPVGVVDAGGYWPCHRAIVEASTHAPGLLATCWAWEELALLAPREGGADAALAAVRAAVAGGGAFAHLVIDLTGFEQRGGHLAAFELVDAVALVARSGRSTLRQLQRCLRDLPPTRGLGVLLTGV
jgi:hypothetical protein